MAIDVEVLQAFNRWKVKAVCEERMTKKLFMRKIFFVCPRENEDFLIHHKRMNKRCY